MRSFLVIFVVLITSCQQRPKYNIAFYKSLGGEPGNFNPISTSDAYTESVKDYVFETLLAHDEDTYEEKPNLATEWKVSKDKMRFTFKLREGVTWHDGMPLTAHDVKYSYDILFSGKFNTAHRRPYYEAIKEVNVIDDLTVEFVVKDLYWGNFKMVAFGLEIIPKHYYEKGLDKTVYNKTMIGTGPYKLALYKRGSRVVLEKNKQWWGLKDPKNDEYHFEKIVLRFASDRNIQLEMLKKGSLDFMGLSAEEYVKKTKGKIWEKSLHKILTHNKAPLGYSWIGWNLKHPILKSRNVRKALYHLVNRKYMIEKFEYNMSTPAAGPVYPSSPYFNEEIKPIEFNPQLALKLLKAEGWKDTDGDNILDKIIDGKKRKFSITILEPSDVFIRYLTVFKEDAKKAGVEINIKQIEWTSFTKLLYEKNFDAVRLAWTASLDWQPKQIWHSSSIDEGSNFISYKNLKADKLIEQARTIYDRDERIKLLKEVQKMIVEDYPYVWFSYRDAVTYAHTDRIQKDKETYQYTVGTSHWKFKSHLRKEAY